MTATDKSFGAKKKKNEYFAEKKKHKFYFKIICFTLQFLSPYGLKF